MSDSLGKVDKLNVVTKVLCLLGLTVYTVENGILRIIPVTSGLFSLRKEHLFSVRNSLCN